jgi:hypothetical protein
METAPLGGTEEEDTSRRPRSPALAETVCEKIRSSLRQ